MYIYIYCIILYWLDSQSNGIPSAHRVIQLHCFSVLQFFVYFVPCTLLYVLCFLPSTYPPHTHTHVVTLQMEWMQNVCGIWSRIVRWPSIVQRQQKWWWCRRWWKKRKPTRITKEGRKKGRKKGKRKNVEKSSTLLIHEYLFLFFATLATLRTWSPSPPPSPRYYPLGSIYLFFLFGLYNWPMRNKPG